MHPRTTRPGRVPPTSRKSVPGPPVNMVSTGARPRERHVVAGWFSARAPCYGRDAPARRARVPRPRSSPGRPARPPARRRAADPRARPSSRPTWTRFRAAEGAVPDPQWRERSRRTPRRRRPLRLGPSRSPDRPRACSRREVQRGLRPTRTRRPAGVPHPPGREERVEAHERRADPPCRPAVGRRRRRRRRGSRRDEGQRRGADPEATGASRQRYGRPARHRRRPRAPAECYRIR